MTSYRAMVSRCVVLVAMASVTGCTFSDDITASAMSIDVGTTYSHLIGRTSTATCVKGNGRIPQYGSGKDWQCVVTGPAGQKTYSVTARPNSCYTATDASIGPAITGPVDLSPAAQLPTFDGCLPA